MFGTRQNKWRLRQNALRKQFEQDGVSPHDALTKAYAQVQTEKKAQAAANREVKEAKQALAKTCQICSRPIFAETGVIAHHGYLRPANGWQTASCPGARKSPFEVSRDFLGSYIASMKITIKGKQKYLGQVESGEAPVSVSYIEPGDYNRFRHPRPKFVSVTPETFEEIKRTVPQAFIGHRQDTFEKIKVRYLAHLRNELEAWQSELKFQQYRYDAWKRTYDWTGETWTKING